MKKFYFIKLGAYFIFIVFVLFEPFITIYAQNKQKEINIAVARFQANNTSLSFARAIEDMVSGMIFKTDLFVLLERSQMNQLLEEEGVSKKKIVTDKDAAQIGKILAVDKIIVGSISKLDNYRIELRVVNVADAKVDISFSEETNSPADFEKRVEEMVINIKNYYLGYSVISGKYDIALALSTMKPFGDLSKGAGLGYGALINVYFNKPFNMVNSAILFSSGIYKFRAKEVYLKSIYMYPIEIYYARSIDISETFNIKPALGLGYLISRIEDDKIEYRADGNYQYRTHYGFNPLVSLRFDVALKLYDRYCFIFSPRYSLFVEKKHLGQIIAYDLGAKMLF